MEDTKSLLIMVLQKIFHDRLKVVEDTYQLIYNYNNGKREKSEYEKTLKNICDLMNEELPSEILVYLLTLVDMPNEDGNQLPIMEKIQKTYSCLAESVRPSLLEYLANKKVEEKIIIKENILCPAKEATIKIDMLENVLVTDTLKCKESSASDEIKQTDINPIDKQFLKPITKRNKNRKKSGDNQEPVKSLLDITANYVIKNEMKLKNMYKTKLTEAWKMINSNFYTGDTLKQCYNTLGHVNKKAKLLRSIENDNITDILMEEYENSDVLLKECNMFHLVNADPFQLGEQLVNKLESLIND